MQNRIAKYLLPEELTAAAPRPPHAVLTEPTDEVSLMNPLEVPLSVATLLEDVVTALAAMRANRRRDLESPDQRQYLDALERQREQFIQQLRAHPEPTILMALFPAMTDQDIADTLGDLDGDDPLGLDDDDLPV